MVSLPRSSRTEVAALSPADARAVLDAVKGDAIEPLVLLSIATGLRQGEALGLRWSDLDLDAGTATVRHALQRIAGGAPTLVEPKTAKSRRTVSLPSTVTALLRAHRTSRLTARLRAGERWIDGDYVFTTALGAPLDGVNLTHRLQRLIASAGLPRLRWHDLRHGAASLLLAQGVHPRVVMEMLGHSTIALTMNTYSHVIPALEREAAERMEEALTG